MFRIAPKPFLLGLFSLAFVGWLIGNSIWGFPGLSAEYLEAHKHEHEHYLEVVKSDDYKRYIQRPHLFDMSKAHDHHFEASVKFIEEYEKNPELVAEEARLAKRGLYFDFFNATLVVVLFIRFGWPPLMRFLDSSIAEKVERMHAAKAARAEAAGRLDGLQSKVKELPEAEARATEESEAAIERLREEARVRNEERLEEVRRELADQEAGAVAAAERRLRRELFDKAAREFEEELRKNPPEYARGGLVDAFAAALEGKRL
ncbi:MAG: hypothetical protein GC168_07270 [Candidatus Hydrogenedens sp.]|nr:hypothetical protein [Candidatus Hydrogenedens sp.]